MSTFQSEDSWRTVGDGTILSTFQSYLNIFISLFDFQNISFYTLLSSMFLSIVLTVGNPTVGNKPFHPVKRYYIKVTLIMDRIICFCKKLNYSVTKSYRTHLFEKLTKCEVGASVTWRSPPQNPSCPIKAIGSSGAFQIANYTDSVSVWGE